MTSTDNLPDFSRNETGEYYAERVSVKCAGCGLHYLGGSGDKEDVLLSASYDPESGTLNECAVCRIKRDGTYVAKLDGFRVRALETYTDETSGNIMVLYEPTTFSVVGKRLRTLEDFRRLYILEERNATARL